MAENAEEQLLICRICIGLFIYASTGLPFQTAEAQQQAAAVPAAEFVVTSEVFLEDQLVSSNRTLFVQNRVYDFRFQPGAKPVSPLEIAILDQSDESFDLLDIQRQVALKLPRLDLLEILTSMRGEISQDPGSVHFLFEDAETLGPEKNSISIANGQIAYRAQGRLEADGNVTDRYFRFVDAYTLLSVSNPRQLPPFARMRLNRVLRERHWIPESVVRRQSGHAPDSSDFFAVTSKHQISLSVTNSDRVLIQNANDYRNRFRSVDLPEYRQLERQHANQSSGIPRKTENSSRPE